jgi:hypothetical protein
MIELKDGQAGCDYASVAVEGTEVEPKSDG